MCSSSEINVCCCFLFLFFLSWILFIYASINIICLALNLGNCIIEMPFTILFAFFSLRRFNRFLPRLVQMASFAKLVLDIRPKGPFYLVLTTDAGRPASRFTLTQVSSEKNCNASVSMQAFYYCLRSTSAIKSIFKLTKSQVIGAAWQSHFRDEF